MKSKLPFSSILISFFWFLVAVGLCIFWFVLPLQSSSDPPKDEVGFFDSHSIVREQYGEDGVQTLALFGQDAALMLKEQSNAFSELTQVCKLDPDRQALVSGPWYRAVVDWARTDDLSAFLSRVSALSDDRLRTALVVPESLPLLVDDRLPITHRVLGDHGTRAWAFFAPLDFRLNPSGVERLAEAIESDPDLTLRLGEEFGLAAVMLLVSPETDNSQLRRFPEITKHVLHTIADRDLAMAFLFGQQETMSESLRNGKISADEVKTAVNRFATLSPLEQEIAVDHPQMIRLLSESWNGRAIGVDVFKKCGPSAADILYRFYDVTPEIRQTVLVGLAYTSYRSLKVINDQKSNGQFSAFLQRAQREGLLKIGDNPPLIATAFEQINNSGNDKIEVYAEVKNLRGQVFSDGRIPPTEEKLYEWIPGYVAYRTASDWQSGHHVTGGDAFWATVDGASTPFMLYGLATGAGKMLVRKAVQEGSEKLASESAGKLLAKTSDNLANNLRSRVSDSTGLAKRFGKEADTIADSRLQFRSGGMNLSLADRQADYLRLAKAGDINGKARLVEIIGDDGAKLYAKRAGYEPIFQAPTGRGKGFDQVYRDGNRIIVVEAKGGGSPLRTYHGYKQGTPEYAREVAKDSLKKSNAMAEEKKAAEDVLTAIKENRLDCEVVRTEHIQGKPTRTNVEVDTGTWAKGIFAQELKTNLVRMPGASASIIRQLKSTNSTQSLKASIATLARPAERVKISVWPLGPEGPFKPRTVLRLVDSIQLSEVSESPLGVYTVPNFTANVMERSW